MTTLTRKQRAILERQQLILEVASNLLQSLGYLGLNMDRIAEAAEYSKGTIYQHFGCKEEVLCALCIRDLNIQLEMFKKAAQFDGNSREKLVAILVAHQLFVKLHRREFSNMLIIKNASIRDKLSPENQDALRQSENQCLGLVAGIVNEAVERGDLVLNDITVCEFVFSAWSLSLGAAQIQSMDIPLDEIGVTEPVKTIWKHTGYLLDGYQWKPLSTDWDYEQTFTRIHKELFHQELKTLKRKDNKDD